MRCRVLLPIAFALAVALPGSGSATEGATEINQARALAGGVTPSDLPGFPITIDGPGSFVLTGDLDLSAEAPAIHAIDIVTPFLTENVTLDLKGFEIAGPATCSGFADSISCLNTGAGNGINGPGASEVVVRNGMIRNMGNHGILIWGPGRVDEMTVKHNAGDGVNTGFGSNVSNVIARDNAGDGIAAGDGSTVRDLVGIGNGGRGVAVGTGGSASSISARDNGGHGIDVGSGSTLTNASSTRSRGYGIYGQGNNVIRGVSAFNNFDVGIFFASGELSDADARSNTGVGIEIHQGTLVRCGASFNASPQLQVVNNSLVRDCLVKAGIGDGIQVLSPARIIDNTVIGDGPTSVGKGIFVNGGGTRLEGNSVRNVLRGIEALGAGNYILGNSVSGSPTAFLIAAGSAKGPIIDLSAGGDIPNGAFKPNVEY